MRSWWITTATWCHYRAIPKGERGTPCPFAAKPKGGEGSRNGGLPPFWGGPFWSPREVDFEPFAGLPAEG